MPTLEKKTWTLLKTRYHVPNLSSCRAGLAPCCVNRMVLHSLSRVAPGLLALRPKLTAESLKPGRLLRVGSAAGHDVHAAVLCWCGGVAFAAPIAGWPHAPAVICGAVPADAAESAVLLDDSLGASPDAVDAAAE